MKIPVPVLFTAQDWGPSREPVREWLTGRLQQTYPLFTGRTGVAKAAGLIDTGKMAVIIDGLDEIAGELGPIALQALDQASFHVVVLSRSAEMASAASQGGLLQGAAAVELQVINPAAAASYLERIQLDPPPDGWHDLINRIRASPASPLAEALNNPLALTLIAWLVFGLVAWLVVGLATGLGYGAPLGLTRYRVGAALEIALAAGLEYGFTFGVFAWLAFGLANAFIDPDSTSSLSPAVSWRNDRRHSMAIGLVVGLMTGLVFGLGFGFGLSDGFVAGLETGTGYGLSLGLVAGFVVGLGISHAWPTTLAAAQLTKRWHTPLHLMKFLDDARERNVLRTVGPVYQFRHARLQDRLAAAAANGRDNDHTN